MFAQCTSKAALAQSEKLEQEIKHEHFILHFSKPELYVDNKSRGRSGHMNHAEMYGQEFCVNVKHVWLSVEKHP